MTVRPQVGVAAALLLCLAGPGCHQQQVMRNDPPTVVLTAGPTGSILVDSARFEWAGQDGDGNLAGYYCGLDDSSPDGWTTETGTTLNGLTFGEHDFYVQAVDDSGARSVAAVRHFAVGFSGSVDPYGTDTTFDIATWNIEVFPKSSMTVGQLTSLIPAMDLDMYALQEICDTNAFRVLLAGLPTYDGLYSDDAYQGGGYHKTAVLYRRGMVSVTHVRQLFWGEVVRPLLEMDVVAAHNGRTFDFRLIVMHLKAGGSGGDRQQRLEACRLLKDYIDGELETGGDSDFVVVGDWNDELDDPSEENVFQEFLDDSLDYCFLTLPLAGNSNYGSYIGGGLIDHLMVTTAALGEYGRGTTTTLRLDDVIPNYEAVISDHRPVLAMFRVFGPGQ